MADTFKSDHDFRIQSVPLSPASDRFIAHCVLPGCDWKTGLLKTRRNAVIAAWMHQLEREIDKL